MGVIKYWYKMCGCVGGGAGANRYWMGDKMQRGLKQVHLVYVGVIIFFSFLALELGKTTKEQAWIITGVNQKVLPVLSTETLLHIWLSTEYYGFRPSSTAVDTVS